MKRDMDLCRKILFALEKLPMSSTRWLEIDNHLPEYDRENISYHVLLLQEAGLIKAINLNQTVVGYWRPVRLTWEGHEFLDAARDDNRWEKAKGAMTKVGGFALDVMKQLLVQYLKQDLNLTS